MKKVKIILAAVTASFLVVIAWVMLDIVRLIKEDAFSFDVFDD